VLFGVTGDFRYLPSEEATEVLKTKEHLERRPFNLDKASDMSTC